VGRRESFKDENVLLIYKPNGCKVQMEIGIFPKIIERFELFPYNPALAACQERVSLLELFVLAC